MSSEQTFSTSDLRSTAQDYKRDAARKHKWHLGAVQVVGRGAGNPRPFKASETHYNVNRRLTKGAVATMAQGNGTKMTRKHDMLEGLHLEPEILSPYSGSDDSASDEDAAPLAPPADVGVMYSFDAPRGPTEGSQILNVALNKAVQKFEEKETVKLVKDEYDVLDSDGESVGLANVKSTDVGKGKAKVRDAPVIVSGVDEDEDYEFV